MDRLKVRCGQEIRVASGVGPSYSFAMAALVEIRAYRDFRAFLRAQFEQARSQNPRWSLGAWARRLELKSTSSLSKVLHGTRRPGRQMVERLKKHFKFDERQSRYFDFLIEMDRSSSSPPLRALVSSSLAKEETRGPTRMLSRAEFNVISKWYTFAIRELLKMTETAATAEEIARYFRFPVTSSQVRESLAALSKVGLIERQGKRFRVIDKNIETAGRSADETRRRHHQATLTQTLEALTEIPAAERQILNMTFVLKQGEFEAARAAIEEFRDDFVSRFSGGGDQVYRIQVQLLPLTYSGTPTQQESP